MLLYSALVLGVLGALMASFAGVIAERMGTGDSWTNGRSRCNACDRTLSTPDLIPIVSYLVWVGRCRRCRARVPIRYLFTECALALAFFFGTLHAGLTLALVVLLGAFFILAIIVLYDVRHTIVPMPLALVFVLLSAIYAASVADDLHTLGFVLFIAGIMGSIFFLLHVFSRGRAMGLGDTPVALALSLIAGPQALMGFLYSFWIGGVVGILILVGARKGHRMGIEVPFVPFLAAGYLLALFTPWNLLPF